MCIAPGKAIYHIDYRARGGFRFQLDHLNSIPQAVVPDTFGIFAAPCFLLTNTPGAYATTELKT